MTLTFCHSPLTAMQPTNGYDVTVDSSLYSKLLVKCGKMCQPSAVPTRYAAVRLTFDLLY